MVVHLIHLRRMLGSLRFRVGGMALILAMGAGAQDRTEEKLSDALVKAVRKAIREEAALAAYCEGKGMAKASNPQGLGPGCAPKEAKKPVPANVPPVPSSAPPEAK